MKKLNLSIIRREANVCVIEVTANLIASVVRTKLLVDTFAKKCINVSYKTNVDGEEITDENGNKVVDRVEYRTSKIYSDDLNNFMPTLVDFLDKLNACVSDED